MRWLGVALLAVATVGVAGGCGKSPTSEFYTLDSMAEAGSGPNVRFGVMVGPVSVPASVDRPEFVIQVAPNRVEIDELHRWAAPLGESIARTVAGDVATLLGTPDVAVAPLANFDPVYRVAINVQRFDSIPGKSVVIEAVWAVRTIESRATRSGRTIAREDVQAEGFEALAAAHSRALSKLSTDIADAIRAAAAEAGS
jgi:hypothetical protein